MAVIGRRADGSALERRLTKKTTKLSLYNEGLATVDLAVLAAAPELHELNLAENPIDRIDLGPLARCCPELICLGVQARTPIDLRPLAAASSLRYLSLYCEEWRELDLRPLAEMKLESLTINRGRFAALDLGPLGRCQTLARFSVRSAAIRQLDLAPLATLPRMQTLHVGHCAELRALDLSVCSRWPQLQRLLVTHSPVTALDLTPLSACPQLEGVTLDRLHLAELDLTPTAALPAFKELNVLPVEGRTPPALTLATSSRDEVAAPAIQQLLGVGWLRRAGLPPEMLGSLAWSYFNGPWRSRQDLSHAIAAAQREHRGDAGAWCPDNCVARVPRLEVVWGDLASRDEPARVTVERTDGGNITALDLMWGIEQAFGQRIGARDHRLFEGLVLDPDSAWNSTPRYQLQLGS